MLIYILSLYLAYSNFACVSCSFLLNCDFIVFKLQNQQTMAEVDESTQIFTFNVMSSSTPCNNQFKKPQFIDATKRNNVRSFDLGECATAQQERPILNSYGLKGGYSKTGDAAITESNQVGNDGLYTLMETTQEYRFVKNV